ncbi:hypothetical protein MARINOS108_11832 [Marinoscillum sp. 108]|nr:hypothetical protein MARINOS108_11832 [Marinoscillum sp. 108]
MYLSFPYLFDYLDVILSYVPRKIGLKNGSCGIPVGRLH